MWHTILRPLAFLALAVGLGAGIYASSVSKPLAYYSPKPGNCTSASVCFNYCQNNPVECSSYCAIDSSHARECASWQVVTISTESGMGSYVPPSGSYTAPTSGGRSYAEQSAACSASPGCTWMSTYCQCGTSGGSGYNPPPTPDYASMEAACRVTPNCTWAGTYCNCPGIGTGPGGNATPNCSYSLPSQPNATACQAAINGYISCTPTYEDQAVVDRMVADCVAGRYSTFNPPTPSPTPTPTPTPTPQPVSCYYTQPSELTESNCASAVDAYIKCDPVNSTRYTSRDQMVKNCVGTQPTPIQPVGVCPAISCSSPQVSCDIPGDGNPCPVCTTSAACSGTPTPSPTTNTSTSTTRTPSPPPGCSFQQPSRPTIDTCTVATDNYIACYPSARQFSSRTKIIQECAGIQPIMQECALPRCTAIEVSCNPPNDNNPCAVCLSERACRQAYETPAQKPEPKPEIKPEPTKEENKIAPNEEIIPPSPTHPPCSNAAECAAYCSRGDEAAKVCSSFCSNPDNKMECRRWADSYIKTRGGKTSDEQRQVQQPEGQDDAAQLAQMKKSFKDWLRNFRDTERRVQKLQSRGVTVTQEIAEAVAIIKEVGASIDAATTREELEERGGKLQDAVQTINESLPSLERLADFGRTLRDADRQIRSVSGQWKRLARRAESVRERTSLVDEIIKQLDEAGQNREAAVAAAGAGNADEAFELVKDVYTGLDEVQEKFRALETVLSTSREIARARREVNGFARELAKLERRGVEVGKLKEFLADVRASLDLVAKFAAQKPFPVDEVVGAIQDFEDAKDSFLLELDELRGTRKEIFPQPVPGPFPLELPSGFNASVKTPSDIFGPAS